MIGIYKITNMLNNKVYIGQSIDIEDRWRHHRNLNKKDSLLSHAIAKYGIDKFSFEVLEECKPEEMNTKEIQYIKYFSSNITGYNILPGGQQNYGENNPNSKLSEEDVSVIRHLYNSKTDLTKKEIYDTFFQNKVGWRGFEKAWSGETWKHIMPEVYSEENKNFYYTNKKSRKGQLNGQSKITDLEVLKIRERYVKETGLQIFEDYKGILTYAGLENILIGKTYSHLPIYRKRLKIWINK